jgi:hypothetical protein
MADDPTYTKTILCLANSRRRGGRCVAGKEFANNSAGPWILPVNVQNQSAISEIDELCLQPSRIDSLGSRTPNDTTNGPSTCAYAETITIKIR